MSAAVDDIMVSVSLITYNHEKYIAKAINSILAQEVNFNYEIIIGDDCSSDGTRKILEDYKRKYPHIIQLILHPRRYDEIPGRTNNMTNLYNCRGKYIAMLDGDDYWISKNKLQVQVNLLEENPEYVLTFHNTLEITEDGSSPDRFHHENFDFLNENASFDQMDVANAWFMQTSTLLFRNHLIGEFPEWFREVYSADYAIQLLLTQFGKVYYLKNLLSARLYNMGSFSAQVKGTEMYHKLMIKERTFFNKKFGELNFSKKIAASYFAYSQFLYLQKSYLKSLYYLNLSILKDRKYFHFPFNSFKRKLLAKLKKR
ncbi:MAG: glycosyltransferase [Leeuwenhoekiella sp.]